MPGIENPNFVSQEWELFQKQRIATRLAGEKMSRLVQDSLKESFYAGTTMVILYMQRVVKTAYEMGQEEQADFLLANLVECLREEVNEFADKIIEAEEKRGQN